MGREKPPVEWILDRWEGDAGILEDLGAVPRALLPRALREGEVLRVVVDNDTVTLTRDTTASRRRREQAQRLRDELAVAEPGNGDVFEL